MERQNVRFYIDRNDKLRCIWYKERTFRYGPNDQICYDFPDGPYVVRTAPMKKSCDKHYLSKVKYCQTERDAALTIIGRLRRNKLASPDTVTEAHLMQLIRAPHKYTEYFFDYIRRFYGEEQRDLMNVRLVHAMRTTIQNAIDEQKLQEIKNKIKDVLD